MYKSKRSLKVYEAPLGLNGKQQIPRIQLQGQWLKALGVMRDNGEIDIVKPGVYKIKAFTVEYF